MGKLIKTGIILFVALIIILILNPLVIIPAGHQGVILTWGAVSETKMDEGLHLRFPIAQKIIKADCRTQKFPMETLAYSNDIQTVETTLVLNFHIKKETVNILWKEVGSEYLARIIDPAIQESVKAATAKFTAQQLIEQRPKVKEQIKVELVKRLNTYFVIDDFSITNFSFSDDFEKSVEQKQVAQQNALKAKNDLERVKMEAEQRITNAKAEAEAIKIQAQAITQQGGKDYVQLKAVEKWNGILPTQMIPNATVPFINLKAH